MSFEFPEVSRIYQNHHLDSTRWEVYQPRKGDVIVTTSLKAGTTWTQQILYQMFHGLEEEMPPFESVTPWPDARFLPQTKPQLGEWLEGLDGRRLIKSHLPLDGLPYYPEVEYLIVARDARDVFMSFFNHYSNYTDLAMQVMNAPDIVGDPLPPCPEDPRVVWRDWITRGWFEWESEGYPFWANLGHAQSYWAWRHLPNFHFLHYADMLADLGGAVSQIAEWIDHPLTPEHHARIVEETTFSTVKARAVETDANADRKAAIFKGGAATFYHKGTNGRWKDVLTDEDLALYEEAKRRVLTPDCAKWLEEGGPVT